MSDTPLKKYVHVTDREREGFVEFNFSINDPTLFLEMILPEQAFEDFCRYNDVTFLTEEQVKQVSEAESKWYGGEVTDISLVHDNS